MNARRGKRGDLSAQPGETGPRQARNAGPLRKSAPPRARSLSSKLSGLVSSSTLSSLVVAFALSLVLLINYSAKATLCQRSIFSVRAYGQ